MLSHYPVLISIYPVIKTAMVSRGYQVLADRVTRGKEWTALRSSVRYYIVLSHSDSKKKHFTTKQMNIFLRYNVSKRERERGV